MKPSDYFNDKFGIYTGKDAETISEMMEKTSLGQTTLYRHVSMLVKQGVMRRVRVKRGGILQSGYIKIK